METPIERWLNTPVPRRKLVKPLAFAYGGMFGAIGTSMIGFKLAFHTASDANQRTLILKEIIDYLVDRADAKTIVELDEKLDFWRIIRGVDTEDK